MNDEYFPVIESWHIPAVALELSLGEMAIDGVAGNEGVALWLGHKLDKKAVVTHVIALRGKGIIKKPDLLNIEGWLFNEITDVAMENGVTLLGQIHSHGRGYGTDLSLTDKVYGVSVPYYLSLVAPDYAQNKNTSIYDCGIHVYEKHMGYRRMVRDEVSKRIHITTESNIPFILVGDDYVQ